jgi:hypothetical protein
MNQRSQCKQSPTLAQIPLADQNSLSAWRSSLTRIHSSLPLAHFRLMPTSRRIALTMTTMYIPIAISIRLFISRVRLPPSPYFFSIEFVELNHDFLRALLTLAPFLRLVIYPIPQARLRLYWSCTVLGLDPW